MKHTRIRPFNTRDTYPEQNLDNDLCQAVRAGDTIYLRGQIGQDLDTRESVGIGDVEAQAERAMANIAMLLDEAGGELADIVKIVVYLTDVRYREPVYRVMGRWLKGVFPVSTGLVVTALARPEWVVEIDATAVVSGSRRVTFSLAGRCQRTGMVGIVVSSSSPAVAARCAHARAGRRRGRLAEHHRPAAGQRAARPDRGGHAGRPGGGAGVRDRARMRATAS